MGHLVPEVPLGHPERQLDHRSWGPLGEAAIAGGHRGVPGREGEEAVAAGFGEAEAEDGEEEGGTETGEAGDA
jgi:hypothetical protein